MVVVFVALGAAEVVALVLATLLALLILAGWYATMGETPAQRHDAWRVVTAVLGLLGAIVTGSLALFMHLQTAGVWP